MTLAAAPVSRGPDVSVSRADIASVRGRLSDEPRKSIERAIAIVGYRRARNAAGRRPRKYCERLFQHHQVSLPY